MSAIRPGGVQTPPASENPARGLQGSPPPARGFLALAALLVFAGLAYVAVAAFPRSEERPPTLAAPATVPEPPSAEVPAATTAPPSRSVRTVPAPTPASTLPQPDFDLPSLEPDDVAAYIRPGDPEPTAAELIEALQEAGIREGLGAFNPPGTRPPMPGIAVPEDFVLPEGFVRHHQVTDEGEPLEPILMFSPDYEFVDAGGQTIAVPEDRVVPPELAPPGLPIRPIDIPAPKD
jgi:hypothetical protein